MKKMFFTFLLAIALLLGTQTVFAQNGPPRHPESHGTGGGAPIGGGLFILLAMGGIYGGMKGYKQLKK